MRRNGPEWERSPVDDGQSAPAWILTFGDTMSLILTFFVLLFSFSTMDPRHFVAVSGEVQDAFGVSPSSARPEAKGLPEARLPGDASTALPLAASRKQLAGALEAMRKSSVEGAQSLRIFETYRGVEVLLPAERVFDRASSEIRPSASALIGLVASVSRDLPASQRVVVEVPADTAEQDTQGAWSLATARADGLAKRLRAESGLPPSRLLAAAAGVRPGQESVTFLVEASLNSAGRPGPGAP